MVNAIKSARNPQAMLNQLMQNNPNYRQVANIINQYGDPKRAFYALAQQQGVDPNEILDLFR